MRRQKRQIMSWLLCTALIVGQTFPAKAALEKEVREKNVNLPKESYISGTVSPSAKKEPLSISATGSLEVTNKNYTASVDLENVGKFTLKTNDDRTKDWNTLIASMVPGTTIRSDNPTASAIADGYYAVYLEDADGKTAAGSAGVSVTGDIEGHKSYFMMSDEIVFLGAGMNAPNLPPDAVMQTVVDAVTLKTTGSPMSKLALTYKENTGSIGYRWANGWLVNDALLPTKAGNSVYPSRNWIFVSSPMYSSAPKDDGYGYYFPDTFGSDNVWYQMEKKEDPNSRNFEIWMQHNNTYQYVIAPNKKDTEFGAGSQNTYQQKTKTLINTPQVQAVADYSAHIVSAHFWEQTAGVEVKNDETGAIVCDGPSAVLVSKDPIKKTLTVAVTPELKTGTTEVTLKTKGTSILSTSLGVTPDLSNNQIRLVLDNVTLNGNMATIVVNTDTFAPEDVPILSNFSNSIYSSDLNINGNYGTGTLMPKRSGEDDYYIADYWETVNTKRLPGTVSLSDEAKADIVHTNAQWKGGSTRLLEYGIQGIRLEGNQINGVQSYMMFGDQIVCLGAGLESSIQGEPIIVTLENLKLSADHSNYITMGYDAKPATTWLNGKAWNTVYDQITNSVGEGRSHSWIYVENARGSAKDYGTAYYFPKDMVNNIRYRFANRETNGVKKDYFEFWMELLKGKDSYDYVIFPQSVNNKKVVSYYTNPENVILENSKEVQAVYQTKDGVLAANFWTDQGGSLSNNYHSPITVHQKTSLLMQTKEGILTLSVSDPEKQNTGAIEIEIEKKGYSVVQADKGVTVDLNSDPNKIKIRVDVSAQTGENHQVSINIMPAPLSPDVTSLILVRGNNVVVPKPGNFVGNITWKAVFLKTDGTTVNNSGYSKIKRELKTGEIDGTRVAGPASVEHLASVEGLSNGNCLLTGKQMGNFHLIAQDENGNEKIYRVKIQYIGSDKLPNVTQADYATLRANWKKSVIGSNLSASQAGREALLLIDTTAEKYWNSYAYKGQEKCQGIPWPDETDEVLNAAGKKLIGSIDTPYTDDALEFRLAIQHVQAMAKAYAAEGSKYYQNAGLLKDIHSILDWLIANCYTAKSQTDNWWTWEIGVPKDLIQALILIYDTLTPEQVSRYVAPLKFFQPDPYHEGACGIASTHAQGYRESSGANLVDCSIIALGIGALLDDNESAYLAWEATKGQFVFQEIVDSTLLSEIGYKSGFYSDGSYIDHFHVPYTGSYGIESIKGGVTLTAVLNNTAWEYPDNTIANLEKFMINSFAPAIYNGMMMDNLKGRAVARSNNNNRDSGRALMTQMLMLYDSVTPQTQKEFRNYLKNWLKADESYLDTLTKADQIPIRDRALEILQDTSVSGEVKPYHISYPYMDRALHRMSNSMFSLSMFSSRIQNCEVTNSENRYGWHQGDGMTYLYNSDAGQYQDNFWNTVNPYRLPGTTVVPVYIGNGTKDSSGYYQDGDYRSHEDWVGGSTIGAYGISGMALSGDIISNKVTYAPELQAKKSWFMFGDEIVCLGSGIQNIGTLPVESVVENRKLKEDGSNLILADGKTLTLQTAKNKVKDIVEGNADTTGEALGNISWLHLQGNTDGADIGYYFPTDTSNLYIRKTSNFGDWMDIGTTAGTAEKTYMELWFEHGLNPKDATYQYVLLPGKTAEQTDQYAKNPMIQVLANTKEVQAVEQKDLGIIGANFWTDSKQTVSSITSNNKASVMLYENKTDHTLTIAVSDPTMKNTGTIELEIAYQAISVLSSDSNVTVLPQNGTTKITVNTKGTNGASSYAMIELKSEAETTTEGPTTSMPEETTTEGPIESTAEETTTEGPTESTPEETTTEGPTESTPEETTIEEPTTNFEPSETLPNPEKEIQNVLDELEKNPDAIMTPQIKETIQKLVKTIQVTSNKEIKGTYLENIFALEEYMKKAFPNVGDTRISLMDTELQILIGQGIEVKGATLSLSPTSEEERHILIQLSKQDKIGELLFAILNGISIKLDTDRRLTVDITMHEADPSYQIIRESIQPSAPIWVTMPVPKTLTTAFPIYVGHRESDGTISWQRARVVGEKMSFLITKLSPYELVNGASVSSSNHSNRDSNTDEDSTRGWKRNSIGWWYERADKTWPSNEWMKENGFWYLFDSRGYLLTGWQKWEDSWYYFNSSGMMLAGGWIQEGGKWYWLSGNGQMYANRWLNYKDNWYYLGSDGSMCEETWISDQGNWYYLGKEGIMAANTHIEENGISYYVNEEGMWEK